MAATYDGRIAVHILFQYIDVSTSPLVDGVEVKAITEYAEQVDIAMRNLGFSRVSNIELVVGGQIEKVLIYEALGKEIYK